MGIHYKNTKNSIKLKNYPKRKTLRELEKLEIDWLVYSYKAKCTVQWAEEHILKDVSRLNPKLASTTNIQIESSQTSNMPSLQLISQHFWVCNT